MPFSPDPRRISAPTDFIERTTGPLRALWLSLAVVGCAIAVPLSAHADANAESEAAERDDVYADKIAQLEEQLGEEFTIVLEAPFVVAGDEDAETVRRRAEGTVRWATTMLKQDYFEKDPVDIVVIYLFKDAESYMRNARALFDDVPGTPYGYYSESDQALVMNIATGGGTLVHEMVHPFMAANFEACPAWFNEGLGSLYEQSRGRDGHIVGLTNWRLAGLQEAIEEDSVPAFETLMTTTTRQFYDDDPGTNYAQARYLLYYLQEHGLLHDYYRTLRANIDDDPGGVESLKTVLETDDLAEFKDDWEAWVQELTFP